LRESLWLEQGKRLRSHLLEGHLGRDGRIDEEIQYRSGGLQVLARLIQRLARRLVRGLLGLFFILIDEMDERVDEIVVDLAKALMGEAQQVQARRRQQPCAAACRRCRTAPGRRST
jgi:hypothetical protein